MSLLLPDWPPKQQYIGKPPRGSVNQTNTTQTERTQQVAAAGSVLPVIYGQVRMAPKIAAVGVDTISGGPPSTVLLTSNVWGVGQIDGVQTIYINGEEMPSITGDGTGNRYQDIVLSHYNGTAGQGIDGWLSSAITGYADTNRYTVNGQQVGAAYSVLSLPKIHRLGGEFPRIEAVVNGLSVYDPRENLCVWSNDLTNSAWVNSSGVLYISGGSITGPFGRPWQIIAYNSQPITGARYYQTCGKFNAENTLTAYIKKKSSDGSQVTLYAPAISIAVRVYVLWDADGFAVLDKVVNDGAGEVRCVISKLPYGWSSVSLSYTAVGDEIGEEITANIYPTNGQANITDDMYFSGLVFSHTVNDSGYLYTESTPIASGARYTDNPALCLADYRSNTAYGMDKTVDWPSVGQAAAFCDRLVGSTPEKSRTFGLLIDKRATNESWMQALRAYAGCSVINRGGVDYLIPEYKTSVSAQITASDIVEGSLKVQKRSLRNAPTLVRVHYTDTTKEPWTDRYAEAKLPGVDDGSVPLRESNVRMSGIQRYSQAMREAVERLNLLNAADLDVSFRMRDEGLKISEMDVIELTHPIGLSNQKLRVTGKRIAEAGRYDIRASEYFDGAYDDQIYTAPPHDNTNLPNVGDIPAVTGLTVGEELFYHKDGAIAARLVVTWNDTTYPYLHEYHVQLENASGDVLQDVMVSGARFVSMALPEEESYTVRVRIKSVVGIFGVAVLLSHYLLGKTALPASVNELRIEENRYWYTLSWDSVPDIDVDEYVVKKVYGDQAYWDDGVFVSGGDGCNSPITLSKDSVAGQITLMVKARDTTGHLSPTAASATLTVPVEGDLIIQSTDIHGGGFTEYSVNTGVIDSATGDLVAVSDGAGGYQELVFDFLFTTARPDPYYGVPEYRFGLDALFSPAAKLLYWHHPASVMTGADDVSNYKEWPGVYYYQPRDPGNGGHSTIVRIAIPAGAVQGRISKLTLNRIVPVTTKEQLNIAVPAGAGVYVEYAPSGGTVFSSQVILQADGGDARSYQVTNPAGSPPNTKLIKTYDASGNHAAGHVDVITKYY